MEKKITPSDVALHILKEDRFSRWLGIELMESGEGYSKITMKIREEMVNGIGIVHGGVTFSMADTAFALACNSHNRRSVALDTSINFLKAVHAGDELIAEAREVHNGRTTGLYEIDIQNQNAELVARFKGLCFRTGQPVC